MHELDSDAKKRDSSYTKWVPFLFLVLFLLHPVWSNAQELEYQLKAELIERFTRFIDWPPDSSDEDSSIPFNICIAGKNPFGKYLENMATEVKIKQKKVQILEVADSKNFSSCRIVFIASGETKRLEEILSYTKDLPILTIGDTEGFAERGVLINFYSSGNYVRFEVNHSAIEESKLRFSSRLLKLARFVDDARGKE